MVGTSISALKAEMQPNSNDLATSINEDIDKFDNTTVNYDNTMPVAQHEKPDLLNHIDNYIHNTINDKMKCNKKEMIGGSGKMTHQIMKLAIEMAILICLFILLSTNQTKHIVSKIFKINLESEITIATIAIYGFLLTILFVILRKIVFMTLKL
jgi:hypothetical protein